jgi:hypothetical protein
VLLREVMEDGSQFDPTSQPNSRGRRDAGAVS